MVTEDSNDVIGDVTVIEMEEGRSRRVHCDFRTEPLTGGHKEEQVYRYNSLKKSAYKLLVVCVCLSHFIFCIGRTL